MHLLEIEDLPWCPQQIRDAATEYLQFVVSVANPYASVARLIREALDHTKTTRIVDLCSGGTGPWSNLRRTLATENGPISVCLTDKFPNLAAFQRAEAGDGAIGFCPDPVDVLRVPHHLGGFRTMFCAFHHFRPEQSRAILQDAVDCRSGIGIFEITHRSVPGLLTICASFFAVFLVTPFIRPRRWSRMFWTYVVPAIPLLVWFDGIVSCLRTYTPGELSTLVEQLRHNDYHWQVGQARVAFSPVPITYLIGYPRQTAVP